LTKDVLRCEKEIVLYFLISLLLVTMVPIDTPRKRIAILFITLLVINLCAGSVDAATKSTTKSTTVKTTVKKATSTTKKTATKSTSKKTTKKVTIKKKKGRVATQVKSSIIAADREMVLNDNTVPNVALPTVIATQSPSVNSMTVTNPVTSDTYSITVNNPAVVMTYVIPPQDIRGYYAQPITGTLSQGIHPVNAVDISAPVGTIVHAAAQGIVIAVTNDDGYGSGYGNYIVIMHPNGTETLYAHLSYAIAKIGDVVSQGQPIAYSGRTGKVTGPHLHFEIRGATNPWGSDPLGTSYSI
jgi:murein DD-endopeptidase MepM/ murein hydrolase activator NlpD